tara:strand:+ start:4864 stop:5529 length:666 start_codon:yes stop_codon:yes gene_type:complete
MIKKFKITGISKKFKGVQKLKPQKTPSRFTSVMSNETVKANQRKLLGDLPEFMGLSQRATGDLAAESVALKTMNKKFFKTLNKELSRSRLRTATGIKGRKLKVKTPTAPSLKQKQAGIFKGSGLPTSKPILKLAKSKGALKSYKTATTKSENVFRKTMEKFTSRTKASPFAKKDVAVKQKSISQSVLKQMGLDDREYFDPKSGKTFINTARGDFLKRKKKV